jgi:hypothetical protein
VIFALCGTWSKLSAHALMVVHWSRLTLALVAGRIGIVRLVGSLALLVQQIVSTCRCSQRDEIIYCSNAWSCRLRPLLTSFECVLEHLGQRQQYTTRWSVYSLGLLLSLLRLSSKGVRTEIRISKGGTMY